jgi:ribosome biogenesis protein Nip4
VDELKAFAAQFTTAFDTKGIVKLGRKYYLATKDAESTAQRITTTPFALGTYLGESKKTFQPSPALLDLLAPTSTRKAVVDKKAAWLYLCGRDVFAKSIIRMDVKEGLVLVMDEGDETLGYGKIIETKKGMMIKNFLDKGAWLRMERA